MIISKVLGIETSCDDTSVAILEGMQCRAHLLASQDHNKFGGILPEYAARSHLKALPTLVKAALAEAELTLADLDCVAVTYAPGLLGSLIVGVNYAKALTWALNKPLIAVHHIEAHILAAQYDCGISFPYGALVASGGHTLLVIAEELGRYTLLGASLDDAAGEAFDKVAREMGLKQPGGPEIERLALEGKPTVALPIPLHRDSSCNFSFSGIKTAAIRAYHQGAEPAALAASFQEVIALSLQERLKNALKLRPDITNWALVGGVAANKYLFSKLQEVPVKFYRPSMKLCTDNGLMIAYTGLLYGRLGQVSPLDLEPISRLSVDKLCVLA